MICELACSLGCWCRGSKVLGRWCRRCWPAPRSGSGSEAQALPVKGAILNLFFPHLGSMLVFLLSWHAVGGYCYLLLRPARTGSTLPRLCWRRRLWLLLRRRLLLLLSSSATVSAAAILRWLFLLPFLR